MSAAPSLTERLGAFVAAPPPIPADVIERAKINLVHNIAMALAARARETSGHVAAARHPGDATLLASGAKSAPDWAALANGALFHVRSQDDVHLASTSHPGAPVIAAALAVAETQGASGRAFLEAIVLGYEVLCRIGRDFDQEASERGFRAAGLWGGFGAAAASARLLKLDAVACGHAISLATHQAGSVLQVWSEGGPEFPFQLGFGARNGVVAAELAAAGQIAGRFMLEGPKGLYHAVSGRSSPPTEALDGLGTDWQLREVTVKPYPCCAVLQGPVQEMLRLRGQIAGSEMKTLHLSLSPFEATFPGIDNAGPAFAGPAATKMSAQFCLGVALLDGRLALADLSRLDDPAIRDIASRINVTADPALVDRQCRIVVELDDGQVLRAGLDEPIGRPSFDEISAFCISMSDEMGISPEQAQAITHEVAMLDQRPDVSALVSAILVRHSRAGPENPFRTADDLRRGRTDIRNE